MGILLATRLKNKRLEMKLSQAELADGICEQGQISRMEKGNYTPGSELLYEISKKLNVSMNYFFDETEPEETKGLEKFRILSKKFIDYRDYETLKYIYDAEVAQSHRLNLSDQIYLAWIESMITFYYYEKQLEAIDKLEATLSQLSESDTIYLHLSNTLMNFYFESGELERFEDRYDQLAEKFRNIRITTLDDLELSIKFSYNCCRFLWLNKNITKAINETTEAIKRCKQYRSNYLLADLYCLLGNISEDFADKEVVLHYFQVSQFLYKMDDNQKMVLTLERYMNEKYV
ncbi:helix-turn-helix domain-containing protein [Streptococcus marmotae]|uniref:helix-turn-helix domain-containing protein n=1 Tax=Streptococcus marmotae TaxID=1825069 RepID=UPI000836829C|nr:helix-turn-helix domain-containing protein [Streptococcus marmotae]